MYMEPRNRKWIARHDIPKALKPAFGGRREFIQVLKETDKAKAQIEAMELEIKWLWQIDRARKGLPPEPREVAGAWRPRLRSPRLAQVVKGASGDAERREREGYVTEPWSGIWGSQRGRSLTSRATKISGSNSPIGCAWGTGEQAPFLESLGYGGCHGFTKMPSVELRNELQLAGREMQVNALWVMPTEGCG
jgi:hypothetical protein